MRVCDKCGAPATQNFELDHAIVDLCGKHVDELKAWLYAPKPNVADKLAQPAPQQTLTLKGRSKAQ
jgi:hypothetical protein